VLCSAADCSLRIDARIFLQCSIRNIEPWKLHSKCVFPACSILVSLGSRVTGTVRGLILSRDPHENPIWILELTSSQHDQSLRFAEKNSLILEFAAWNPQCPWEMYGSSEPIRGRRAISASVMSFSDTKEGCPPCSVSKTTPGRHPRDAIADPGFLAVCAACHVLGPLLCRPHKHGLVRPHCITMSGCFRTAAFLVVGVEIADATLACCRLA
jgi:hypothetical protein